MKSRIRKTQVKHFTVSEETKFRQVVGEGGNPRDNLILDILFSTGLRLGELTALNVGDVTGKDYLTVVGKGRKERTIPIGAVEGLKVEIESFLEWKRGHKEDTYPRSPLFCSKPGNRRITDRAIQYMVTRYAKKARLERKFHPHACRHTFGFKLGRKGVPIEVIKKLMGHSKIETTSIYVDPDMDQLKNALKFVS